MHVRSNLCFCICFRHLVRAFTYNICFPLKTPIFLQACATCSELQSNISTMVRLLSRIYYLCYRFSLGFKALRNHLVLHCVIIHACACIYVRVSYTHLAFHGNLLKWWQKARVSGMKTSLLFTNNCKFSNMLALINQQVVKEQNISKKSYIETSYIKWVKTSWTHSIVVQEMFSRPKRHKFRHTVVRRKNKLHRIK